MAVPSILQHVTLSTGHVRESPREEVRSDVIAALSPLVHRLAAGDEVALPWVKDPPCTLTGTAAGDAWVATVWGPPIGDLRVPLCTIGVARGPVEAEALWSLLHDSAVGEEFGLGSVTPPDQMPPLPWCAARIEVGIVRYSGAAHWLADFERCVGWTWVQRGETRPGRLTTPPSRPARAPRPGPRPPPRRRRR